MTTSDRTRIAIIGGGPIGLFLACRLRQLGVHCIVWERLAEPRGHSRAVGVQPPSMLRMRTLGLADTFVERGVPMRRALIHAGGRLIGTLDLSAGPDPFPYILAVPQYETEAILQQHLHGLDASALRRGVAFESVADTHAGVTVVGRDASGSQVTLQADLLVGCDGKDSAVRAAVGLTFEGRAFDDAYAVGDFEGDPANCNEAWFFYHRSGVVETFPVTRAIRRWVVKTARYERDITAARFCALVRDRTGHDLAGRTAHAVNPVGVQSYAASTLRRGRVYLAGDAAHVVIPVGGQGMNLGWMNAWPLAETLQRILHDPAGSEALWAAYEPVALARARKVAKMAESNMQLGRKSALSFARTAAMWATMRLPIHDALIRRFTMRDVE